MNIYEHIHEQTGLPYGAVKDHLYKFLDELQAFIAGESDYYSPEEIAEDFFIPREYLYSVLHNIEQTTFTIELPTPPTCRDYNRLLARIKAYSYVVKCPMEHACSNCVNNYLCTALDCLATEIETKAPKPQK